jgi:L-gulonolactone oxidase
MRLVDGRGAIVELAAGDPRLDGARVHLGALGVITEVTLRTTPAFTLAEHIDNVPIADAIRELDAIARSAEYVKVWWLPHTPLAQVYRYTRTGEPATRLAFDRWIDQHVVHGVILPGLFASHRVWPASIPPFNRAAARVYLNKARRVGPSPALLSTPMPVGHRETEAAVPLARAGDALARVVRLIDDERVRVNFIVEVRFVRGDAGWMSPAHGGDVAQIGAYMSQTRETDRYFAAFWRAMRDLGARPHWGKELDHDAAEIRALWPEAGRFAALRDQLDPARTFTGRFHARVLGA